MVADLLRKENEMFHVGQRIIFKWNKEAGQNWSDGEIIRVAKNGSLQIRGWRNRLGRIDPVEITEWIRNDWVEEWKR